MGNVKSADVGHLIIAALLAVLLGMGGCAYQQRVLHSVFPGGTIVYGEFKSPGGAALRARALERPLLLVSLAFLAFGGIASALFWALGHRWSILLVWCFLALAFIPFFLYNTINSVQGDASVFI